MEGRPRTSTFSFSLPLVYSLILNGMVIFMYFSNYYEGVVKHLLVSHNLWDLWAWETECDWDCLYEDAFSFMSEMCYKFGLGSDYSDPCADCSCDCFTNCPLDD